MYIKIGINWDRNGKFLEFVFGIFIKFDIRIIFIIKIKFLLKIIWIKKWSRNVISMIFNKE